MRIVKEYNLKNMKEQLWERIKECRITGTKWVNLDIVFATQLNEILERVAELEKIQKEAEGYIGEYGCIGHYSRSDSECLNCDRRKRCKEIKNNELEDNRKCFGACVKDDYSCTHCADYEKCLEETEDCEWDEEEDL